MNADERVLSAFSHGAGLSDGVELDGGYLNTGRVFRVGRNVVRKQEHRWPVAVEQALSVLKNHGFDHCPRPVARLSDREVILSFVDGLALPRRVPAWSAAPQVLRRVVRLVNSFSIAAEGVGRAVEAADWLGPVMTAGDVIVHGDPHPTNVVFDEDRRPCGLIDFELATTGSHACNMVSVMFAWAPLEPQEMTCWRLLPALDAASRLRLVLEEWTPTISPVVAMSAAESYVAWRMTTLRGLASMGNPGAVRLVEGPAFESRHRHALQVLAATLRTHC